MSTDVILSCPMCGEQFNATYPGTLPLHDSLPVSDFMAWGTVQMARALADCQYSETMAHSGRRRLSPDEAWEEVHTGPVSWRDQRFICDVPCLINVVRISGTEGRVDFISVWGSYIGSGDTTFTRTKTGRWRLEGHDTGPGFKTLATLVDHAALDWGAYFTEHFSESSLRQAVDFEPEYSAEPLPATISPFEEAAYNDADTAGGGLLIRELLDDSTLEWLDRRSPKK